MAHSLDVAKVVAAVWRASLQIQLSPGAPVAKADSPVAVVAVAARAIRSLPRVWQPAVAAERAEMRHLSSQADDLVHRVVSDITSFRIRRWSMAPI